MNDKTETLRRTTITIVLLLELNNVETLMSILNKYDGVQAKNFEEKKVLLKELIIPDAFVYYKSVARQVLMTDQGVSELEYARIIDKITQ